MQSPDESSHLARALAIANGQPMLTPLPANLHELRRNYAGVEGIEPILERTQKHGGPVGAEVDISFMEYARAFDTLGEHGGQLPVLERQHLEQLQWTAKTTFYPMPGTHYYFPLVYTPQVLGWTLGQALELSINQSYWVVRTLSILTSLCLLATAFRYVKASPIVMALLMLPMNTFQMLSPTIDGVTTALAVVCLSMFVHARATTHSISWRFAFTLCLGVFVLAASRNHLAPLLALPLILAVQRKSNWLLGLGILATLCAVGWALFAVTTANDQRVFRALSASQLLGFYVVNPLELFAVIGRTLGNADLLANYLQSFIGVLGWMNVPLQHAFYPFLVLGLLTCGVASASEYVRMSRSELRRDTVDRGILIALALVCVTLTFLAMLISWSPHPAQFVQGVQGRYFVVPALMLAMAISEFSDPKQVWHSAIGFALASVFAVVSVSALLVTLVIRYPHANGGYLASAAVSDRALLPNWSGLLTIKLY